VVNIALFVSDEIWRIRHSTSRCYWCNVVVVKDGMGVRYSTHGGTRKCIHDFG